MEEVIKGYNFLADLILQEWLVRSIGTAFFGWVSVVVIRVIKYSRHKKLSPQRKKSSIRSNLYLSQYPRFSI